VAAGALLLGAIHALFDAAAESVGFALCAAFAHGYAGWRAHATPSAQSNLGHRLLAWMLAAAAALHAGVAIGALLAWPEPAPWLLAAWAVQVAAALALAQLALLASTERTVTELRDSRRRLRFLANIDMLTQVPNRRHFGELARQALARQAHRAAAVLMFDIDHFKRINDELGHAAGDRALRVVSQCVQGTLRGQDIAGRHGGDEFVLLLPDTSMRDAMAVATRIVARAQGMAHEQAIPQLSLSFGMVQIGDDESLEDAMRRADQALYEAKRQGRGRAVSAAGDEHAPVFVESRRLGLMAQ
jgi:diguanylate cyclase (GGDEF)-like protein